MSTFHTLRSAGRSRPCCSPAAVRTWTTCHVDSGCSGKILLPLVGHTSHRHSDPCQFTRGKRLRLEQHSSFFWRSIPLSQIARPTSSRNVLPNMHSTTRAGHYVVNRVCNATAVLTAVIISCKHRATRKCCAAVIRDLDHIAQSNYERARNAHRFRMDFRAVVFNDFRFVRQHQTHCASRRHNTERLVCCIQYQRASHRLCLVKSPTNRRSGTVPIF